jgi:uncharacterized protein YdhG (YjbR/CyaY superfamily)
MSVIDDYLQNVAPGQRAALERVRQIARQTVPEAQETITYRIPTLKLQGKYLIGFAAFRDHLSLFPTGAPIEELRESLSQFKLSKGTIQFTEDNPIPEATIKELINARLANISKS